MTTTSTTGTRIAYQWAKASNLDAERIVQVADLAGRIDDALAEQWDRCCAIHRVQAITARDAALLQAAAVLAAQPNRFMKDAADGVRASVNGAEMLLAEIEKRGGAGVMATLAGRMMWWATGGMALPVRVLSQSMATKECEVMLDNGAPMEAWTVDLFPTKEAAESAAVRTNV